MKRLGNKWLLVMVGAAAVAGCNSSDPTSNRGSGGSNSSSSGGSNGSSGSGGSSTPTFEEVLVQPDGTGWVDMGADWNSDLGIQGAWYGYGDAYGDICSDPKLSGMKCNDPNVGDHPLSDCSMITKPMVPADPSTGFPPDDMSTGKMCTSGTIAKVANIVNSAVGTVGQPDYSNVWGAGIGLDLAGVGMADPCAAKGTYSATDHHVVGIKFDIDTVPSVGLRVEFPIPSTDGTKNGSDYWGATSSYPNSPVMAGTNTIYFDPSMVSGADPTAKGVTPAGPAPNITFDPSMMEAVQFHVPAGTSSAYPASYSFCISNLKFLIQK